PLAALSSVVPPVPEPDTAADARPGHTRRRFACGPSVRRSRGRPARSPPEPPRLGSLRDAGALCRVPDVEGVRVGRGHSLLVEGRQPGTGPVRAAAGAGPPLAGDARSASARRRLG